MSTRRPSARMHRSSRCWGTWCNASSKAPVNNWSCRHWGAGKPRPKSWRESARCWMTWIRGSEMNLLESLIDPLGWTLLHFLWQGAVIGLLHEGVLHLCRRRSPESRYLASLLFMAALAVAPLLTFFVQWADSITTAPVELATVTLTETTAVPASSA